MGRISGDNRWQTKPCLLLSRVFSRLFYISRPPYDPAIRQITSKFICCLFLSFVCVCPTVQSHKISLKRNHVTTCFKGSRIGRTFRWSIISLWVPEQDASHSTRSFACTWISLWDAWEIRTRLHKSSKSKLFGCDTSLISDPIWFSWSTCSHRLLKLNAIN